MAEENEYLQTFIRRGPGWTDAQKHDRDCIIQKLESERNTHDQTQNDLFNIRQRIDHTESKILDVDKLRDHAAVDLQRVEKRIEESNNKYLAKQTQMNEAENRIETLTLQLQEYQEQLRYNDENIKEEMLDSKKITQSTKDVQLDIEKCCREFKEYGRKMVPISKELERQHQKNIELETENREQIKLIDEKTNEAMLFAKETVISEKKKELISEKIVDAEKRRIECEGERDDLKLKLNKLGSVELKMIAEEMETQKRQLEGLKREMGLLERKKTLTEHSSSLVQDIIASNSSTLKNLQNESEACSVIAKRHTRDIEELQKSLNKEREGTNIATRKRREALNCLVEQELQIEDIHKKLESAETTRKQKQSQCDSIKAECNLQAKRLAENHDGLELAKRKIGLIRRETKTLKVQILSTENNTVMEHYNHHHAGEEKEVLKNELDKLRLQMADTDQLLERNNNELLELGNLIANKDRECDKYSKEYSVLASNRDILGSLLVQKSAELEKLHEQIQGQQSILHHGELQYSELVSSIQGHVMKLKDLLIKKEQNVELEKVNNELTIEAHALENNIHSDKLRTVALRDELGRPANIHRWRSLEHRDPQKFEKIKRIQRLQKQMIATTETITEKDVLIREQEREYLELQRISSHQPQLSEVQEQLEIYQSNLSEKLGQMEQIEFELEVQKRRVSDLNEDIQSLESEGKYLQEEWIQERKANESFTSK
jgi:chromosome segregation ATPase